MRRQMGRVFAESTSLPVPGQGRFPAVAFLAKSRPVSRPSKHLFPLFVDHQRTNPEKDWQPTHWRGVQTSGPEQQQNRSQRQRGEEDRP